MVERFGISPQQASADIVRYNEIAPSNAVLDPGTKAYVRTPKYSPVFPKNAFEWMKSADDGAKGVIPCESVPMPLRRLDDAVLRMLAAAFESRTAVRISYQSLSTAEPSQRIICPHHVVDTSDRAHVRAWDDRRRIFTDFVIGRIMAAEMKPDYPWVDAIADTHWHETVDVQLAAHQKLSKSQRTAIEREYGMQGGKLTVTVRKALLIYLLDRLGLLESVQQGHGVPNVARRIRCLNAGELKPYIPGNWNENMEKSGTDD